MKDNRLLNMLPILWKWRKEIIISVLTGTILTGVIMFLRPNYYEGVTTFYPVSNTLLKPIVDGTERDLRFFGDDHDVDRLLSISKSSELGEEIIDQFDLALVYGLDTSKTRERIRLRKKFNKLYSSTKTQYDAIRISMEDTDPGRASQIANAIRNTIDQKAGEMIKRTQEDIISSLTKSTENKEKRARALTDSIKALRQKYKIYDTQYQGEALANIEMRSPKDKSIRKLIDDYTEGITDVVNLENELEEVTKSLANDTDNLEKIMANHNVKQPAIHVVEIARKPDEKSRPKRSLYVLAAFIFLTFIASLTVLLIEKSKDINWKEGME